MQKKIETIILSKLFSDEEYTRKVIPFMKSEYFHDSSDRKLYEYIAAFINKYNSLPTIEAIDIAVQNDRSVNEREYKEINESLNEYIDNWPHFNWNSGDHLSCLLYGGTVKVKVGTPYEHTYKGGEKVGQTETRNHWEKIGRAHV